MDGEVGPTAGEGAGSMRMGSMRCLGQWLWRRHQAGPPSSQQGGPLAPAAGGSGRRRRLGFRPSQGASHPLGCASLTPAPPAHSPFIQAVHVEAEAQGPFHMIEPGRAMWPASRPPAEGSVARCLPCLGSAPPPRPLPTAAHAQTGLSLAPAPSIDASRALYSSW